MRDCFALLDDRDSTRDRPTSRLYTDFVREHTCADPATLDATWACVEADQADGLHAVLLADYEWGARLLKAGHGRLAPDDSAALRVLMFRGLARLGEDEVRAWLAGREAQDTEPAVSGAACGVMDLAPSVERGEFVRAIDRIHEAIAAGETYQVNYTFRLHGAAWGRPVALYRALRARQPVSYGALIALPADGRAVEWVLSRSPELFLRHEAGVLTARPMKGTAARHAQPESDSETARMLAEDEKNRAENLMIVDLLRNDLGRVAQIGSVKVPALFAIEPYATLFQMTSTVQARLRPEVDLPGLLRAVFPCGSITGAPKHHTMALIAGLETMPRGLYCGAIGWVDAPPEGETRCGDFCLSVAIRTLSLGPQARGRRGLALGIGAGIVKDSRADDEYDECLLKARFLTGFDPGFELFETLLVTARGEIPYLGRHLVRLAGSARVFGFRFDREAALSVLHAAAASLPRGAAHRLRLDLAHDGQLDLRHAVLAPLPPGSVGLIVAPESLPFTQPLSAHKTTLREAYDAGILRAEQAGAFDSLFFRADGRLVEGGRSSVFLRLGGRWWTPPVADGALPGVMRAVLLEDPAWAAGERHLTRDDLLAAEAIVACNGLRGPLAARLLVRESAGVS